MDNFPSNSHQKPTTPRGEQRPDLKVVTEGTVTRRPRPKKPLGPRIYETFFSRDPRDVFEYVVHDVLVPALKDMILDAVNQGSERTFFPDGRPANRRSGSRSGVFGSSSSPIAYNKYSGSRREERSSSFNRTRSRASNNFDDIVFSHRDDAIQTIEELREFILKYEFASVRNLYEAVGEKSNHVDEKWGWTDLRSASISRSGNGYVLNLPPVEEL